jgi:RHS repeat-associated protein
MTSQLSENSHQGFDGLKAALYLGSTGVKSNTASGLQLRLRQKCTGSRSSGKERDAETGLDFFETRYLSAAQGRFTGPDSYNIVQEMNKGRTGGERQQILASYLSNPQVWNKYAYVLNNPLKHTDPDGRRELTKDDEEKLKRLKRAAGKDKNLLIAVTGAVAAIEKAIAAVPEGQKDPASLGAALWAIGQIGNTSFGKGGSVSFTSNSNTISVGSGDWKCNVFVAESFAVGGGIGLGGSGYPVNGRYMGLGSLWGSVNAVSANELANPSADVANFGVTSTAGVGDIAAFQAPAGYIGHSTINLGGGALVYAGENAVKVGTVGQNMEGHTAVTYRRYKP